MAETGAVRAGAVEAGVTALRERGYCVVECALNTASCILAAKVLDELIAGGQARDAGSGYVIHPLCTRDARFHPLFCHPLVLGIMAELFGEPPRLAHSGSRVTDPHHRERLRWHIHPFTPEEQQIRPGDPRRGAAPQRLLCNWYVEGLSLELGPLLVLPRRYDDPLAPPIEDRATCWPGEVAVTCPPGSAVLFTTELWHAALPGSGGLRRRLFGGHFQGALNRRAHCEDQVHSGAVIQRARSVCPAFSSLLG